MLLLLDISVDGCNGQKRMKGNEPRIMDQALNHYVIKITKPVVLCMQHPVSAEYQHMSTAIGGGGIQCDF